MNYPSIEKFLAKYEGQVALLTAKKYGLFFASIYFQDDLNVAGMRLVAEVGQPTLGECMVQLEMQIGRGDVH